MYHLPLIYILPIGWLYATYHLLREQSKQPLTGSVVLEYWKSMKKGCAWNLGESSVKSHLLGPKLRSRNTKNWLVVSTHLKNISQIRPFPQVGVKIKKYLKPPPRKGWSLGVCELHLSNPTFFSTQVGKRFRGSWNSQKLCQVFSKEIELVGGFNPLESRKVTCPTFVPPSNRTNHLQHYGENLTQSKLYNLWFAALRWLQKNNIPTKWCFLMVRNTMIESRTSP